MMPVEQVIHWIGGAAAFAVLAFLLISIWRGTKRAAGRRSGLSGGWLHSGWFYVISTAAFLGLSWLGWRPLPVRVPEIGRMWMLGVGALFYFGGLAGLLAARLTMGRMYFVSSGFGAELFADHKLITTGPFALVRHPMYVSLILTAAGSLLIYFTWTTLVFFILAPAVLLRILPEERVLEAEFGEAWREYCRRVPALLPRIKNRTRITRKETD